MGRFIAKVLRGRGGNVALVAAIMAPVVVVLAGGAVDLTNASMRQAQLQAAADAAAIASIARNSAAYADAINSAYSTSTIDLTASDSNIAQQALAVFNADLQNTSDTTPTFNLAVTKTGTTVSSSVTVASSYTPFFLGLGSLFHWASETTVPLGATSTASDNIPAYMNFYMLLDNTPSMGIGATTADISNIIAATNNGNGNFENGCSFACHSSDPSWDAYDVVQTYAASKNLTVNLRIDVVRQATQQLTQTASSTEQTNGISDEFQMAVYDFGTAAVATSANTTYSLHQDSQLSPDLTTTVYNNANAVALMETNSNNDAFTNGGPPPSGNVQNLDSDTSFDYTMTQLGNIMVPNGKTGGNGSTAQSPVPILFMVTDGMVDQYASSSGNCQYSIRYCGGINPATCTAIKNKGIIIAILYTTYWPQSLSDNWSQEYAAPVLPQIQPALQACSSGPKYFEPVSPTGGISQAMQDLFESVVAQVKITK